MDASPRLQIILKDLESFIAKLDPGEQIGAINQITATLSNYRENALLGYFNRAVIVKEEQEAITMQQELFNIMSSLPLDEETPISPEKKEKLLNYIRNLPEKEP